MILGHGLGGRTDLPLPTWMVLYGGAVVLLASFAALVVLWPRPRWEGRVPGVAVADAASPPLRVLKAVGRVVGLVAFAVVLVAAIAGDNNAGANIAPVVVYVTFWVGLTFVSGLVGDLWAVLNPFDTMAAALEDAEPEDAELSDNETPRAASGYWPAAAGLFAFVWLELVYPDRAEPRVLAVAIVGYTAVVLVATRRWGRGWLRHGEAFTALFGILAHAAPVGRSPDGGLRLRPPFAGLAALRPERGLDWVVLVVLGSTSFDGLTRTQLWTDFSARFSGAANTAVGTVGLVWAIALVWVIYHAAMLAMSRTTGGERDPHELGLAFAPSLVPIALAYSVAHYFSLFVLEGQAVVALVSDPFGLGWDLFGTAGQRVDFTILSPNTIAYIQAGAIVVGHVAGVIVAHDRALALFGQRNATRSQYPLLAAMVLFTVGGLFLLLGG